MATKNIETKTTSAYRKAKGGAKMQSSKNIPKANMRTLYHK